MSAGVSGCGSGCGWGPQWFPLAFVGFMVLVVLAKAFFSRSKRRFFEEISSFLPGTAGGGAFNQDFHFEGRYKNRPVRVQYRPGGEDSPDELEVSLLDPLFSFDLRISEENTLSRMLDTLGLARDLRSGDKAFDERFKLKSSAPGLAGSYLANPAARRRLMALFDRDGVSLQLLPVGVGGPGAIKFTKRRVDLAQDLAKQNLIPVLDLLDQLSSPKPGKELYGGPPDNGQRTEHD